VVVAFEVGERPEPDVEATLYFVVAEALTNVAKYAAASVVEVRVVRSGDEIMLTVKDDGVGGADTATGSGLRGLADRVAVVDGTLDIESAEGRGTELTCRVPLRSQPRKSAVPDAAPREPTPVGVGQ